MGYIKKTVELKLQKIFFAYKYIRQHGSQMGDIQATISVTDYFQDLFEVKCHGYRRSRWVSTKSLNDDLTECVFEQLMCVDLGVHIYEYNSVQKDSNDYF